MVFAPAVNKYQSEDIYNEKVKFHHLILDILDLNENLVYNLKMATVE